MSDPLMTAIAVMRQKALTSDCFKSRIAAALDDVNSKIWTSAELRAAGGWTKVCRDAAVARFADLEEFEGSKIFGNFRSEHLIDCVLPEMREAAQMHSVTRGAIRNE